MGSVGSNFDVKAYAAAHGDIWITENMRHSFSDSEIKTMVDRVNEVYKEFGFDPNKDDQKLVYSLYSEPKLEDDFGKAALRGTSLEVNPNAMDRKDINNTIYHEMGHAVESFLLSKLMPTQSRNSENMANRLVLEANSTRRQRFPESNDYISNYGLTNNRELVAEAVKDYMMHKGDAKPMSQAIVYRMKKMLKTRLQIGE